MFINNRENRGKYTKIKENKKKGAYWNETWQQGTN